jgi:hypothetical protein
MSSSVATKRALESYAGARAAHQSWLNKQRYKAASSDPQGEIARAEDPRADLADDSLLWARLLVAARRTKLYGDLHGFRCCGSRLEMLEGGTLRMSYDPDRDGFSDQAHFEEYCSTVLTPHAEELKRLAEMVDGVTAESRGD